MNVAVLKEGYTTTKPVAFLRQFRHQLRRLDRVLSPLGRGRVTPRALQDFIAIARAESCKLSLARYLFHPDDVAERIRAQVRRSSGESTDFTYIYADEESRRKLSHLANFEAGLLRALTRDSESFWVGPQTSSRLNALVEQPINTVVLTVKPPGSSLEIEIKRAGHRSELPLNIVHDREGRPLPPSHRLNGGSSADMLQWEAGSSACLAKIYWLAHRSPPPISIATSIAYPNTLPVGDGPCQHLIDYFSDPRIFGDDFPRMRQAMSQSIASFAKERGEGCLSELQGPWAETLRFFEYAVPGQSMLVGSTSFRLQQLSRYLSSDGALRYFGDGPESCVPAHEARRFADTLLEEVLGLYRPPDGPYESHEAYLDAAFARPENRARANRVHASLTRQLGTFWATVLALRTYSYGESFVAQRRPEERLGGWPMDGPDHLHGPRQPHHPDSGRHALPSREDPAWNDEGRVSRHRLQLEVRSTRRRDRASQVHLPHRRRDGRPALDPASGCDGAGLSQDQAHAGDEPRPEANLFEGVHIQQPRLGLRGRNLSPAVQVGASFSLEDRG